MLAAKPAGDFLPAPDPDATVATGNEATRAVSGAPAAVAPLPAVTPGTARVVANGRLIVTEASPSCAQVIGDVDRQVANSNHALAAMVTSMAAIESSLMRAFAGMPTLELPFGGGEAGRRARIFELRTYESHSEAAGRKKIEMFETGGELSLFRKAGLMPGAQDGAATGAPYTVFGYKGKQVRDNIHSSDLIAAFHAFLRSPRSGAHSTSRCRAVRTPTPMRGPRGYA